MTDWYIHDPAEGRIGPLSADDVRSRYRQRRIQRDTLVWHAGMREWQPLDRLSEELQIDGIVQDTSMPPPLPSGAASGGGFAAQAHDRPAHLRRAAPPPKRGLSGCAIVAIVLAVLAVPMFAILAAIALPAYNDYTVRAKTAMALAQIEALHAPVTELLQQQGRCPGPDALAPILAQINNPQLTKIEAGALTDGRCAYEVTLANLHPKVDGRTVLFTQPAQDGLPWQCSGTIDARYLPSRCRATP